MDRVVLAVLVGVLALSGGQAVAQSARWGYVGSGATGHVYIDTQTIERTGNVAEAWFREETLTTPSYISTRVRYKFDCPVRKIAAVALITYSSTGAVKSSDEQPYQPYRSVVPDSAGENAWAAACPEEAEPMGLEQVGALGRELRAKDPNFDRKFDRISSEIQRIQQTLPATQWARAIRSEWESMPTEGRP